MTPEEIAAKVFPGDVKAPGNFRRPSLRMMIEKALRDARNEALEEAAAIAANWAKPSGPGATITEREDACMKTGAAIEREIRSLKSESRT